jgi:hypothetical protein
MRLSTENVNCHKCDLLIGRGEVSPVKVYVSTTSFCGITAEELELRGTAILALVLKLQAMRPVELYLTAELGTSDYNGNTILVILIESRPLSVSHAAYCLTSAGFARRLTYGILMDLYSSQGNFAAKFDELGGQYPEWIKTKLECSESDIYIGTALSSDLFMSEPAAWVNIELARFNGENL